MTDRHITELKVGLLVVACIAAVAGFIFFLGDFRVGPVGHIHADFDSTGGIKEGAPVRMIGVEIGRVSEIKLVSAASASTDGVNPVRVRITAEIPSDQFRLIPANVTASISSQSVLGEKHLELTPAPTAVGSASGSAAGSAGSVSGSTPSAPGRVRDGAILEGRPPAGIEKAGDDAVALLRQVSSFMDENRADLTGAISEVHRLAARANEFMDKNGQALDETVANLHSTSKALADGVSGHRLENTLSRADVVMKRLDVATVDLDTGLPRLMGDMSRLAGNADGLITDMDRLLDGISAPATTAVTDLQAITTGARAGQGTLGKLITDSSLFEDMAALVADIKAHPWKLIFRR